MISRRGIVKGLSAIAASLGIGETFTRASANNPSGIISLDDPRFETFAKARREFWAALGRVDDDVIAYLVSPQFNGAPAWPTTRQSYLIVRASDTLIIASDGLTDLFVDTNLQSAGFETEVYLESADLVGAGFEDIRKSWQFSLLENFAQNVASFGGINHTLDDYTIISMELPAPPNAPERWINASGNVGALINIEVEGRASHCSLKKEVDIRMVPLTPLLPDETQFIVEGGHEARIEMAQRLVASGVGLVSSADRRSVLA